MTTTAAIADIYDTGKSGIYFIKHFWSRIKAQKDGLNTGDNFAKEWITVNAMLDALGLGVGQVFEYLYGHNNSFDEFEDWVLERNGNVLPQEKINQFHQYLRGEMVAMDSPVAEQDVLTADDLQFWDENGYVIIHDAISPAACMQTEALIWQHLGIDKNDPSTWYQQHDDKQGIMVQLFQHPLLKANRESKRIRKAYEQLWGTSDLWINTDRVGFNPPETEHWKFPGPHMHWDVSLTLPIPFGLQGILYLTDTAAEQGAFTLVPGFHRRIEEWIHSLPPGANPRTEDIHALGSKPLAGKAGDFIIWHHALPHGSRPNTTTIPRIVQYINMQPLNRIDANGREWR
jgi:ectoine hydroxylase-related dioxygenase (phytanoyl-CoA dioxygenase family)